MVGTLLQKTSFFDGIACNDKHMTTQLESPDSFITFNTPGLSIWSSENTIEFWFKVQDPAAYYEDALLFSMVSSENNPQDYYHVYIKDGALKCAPFGSGSQKDPIITFDQFKLGNADTYGWWHIACGYSFQNTAKGTLFNTNVVQTLEETMVRLPKFYPTNSLIGSFGKSASNN